MQNILQRIQQIAKNEGIKITALERKIGASKGVLSRAITNGTDIQSKWVQVIVENYPQYSSEWILTGKGKMLRSEEPTAQQPVAIKSLAGIPLIPIEAMAGFGTGELQVMEYECERFVIPTFREAEFLIAVKGSSMYPKYSSGDIVACKKLSLDTFFQWNKVYVLDTEQGALIKRINKGSDNEHLLIVSENPKYESFELHRSRIHSIAIVIGVIRLE
jgi:phage repressor protein C with HTH and peptisase S24 domain